MILNKRSNLNTLSKPMHAYLHDCIIYADQLFFAVITTPWCMLLSSLHSKHFTDSVQSNVENSAALRRYLVQEGNIYSMGSETH